LFRYNYREKKSYHPWGSKSKKTGSKNTRSGIGTGRRKQTRLGIKQDEKKQDLRIKTKESYPPRKRVKARGNKKTKFSRTETWNFQSCEQGRRWTPKRAGELNKGSSAQACLSHSSTPLSFRSVTKENARSISER
jgi:hypothetical protein